ncbi:MAG: glycosyltransferase, partial [Pseudomonadales bacterium]|nr:glycosyltransferase [Pseudomonadales bacterium]
ATALVMPSLYEGFGLPALEAMQHGVPVVGANRSSIPEVVGEAGLLVDPESVDDLASAMQRLIDDEPLRQEMARRAKARSTLFSWELTAQKTLDVLVS